MSEYLLFDQTLDDDIDIDSDAEVNACDRLSEYWNMNMFRAKPVPQPTYS